MGSGIILRKLLSAGGKETLTDESGRFSLEIGSDAPDKYTLSAALEGYVGQSVTVQVTKKFTAVSFTLRKTGEFGMTGEFTFGDPFSNRCSQGLRAEYPQRRHLTTANHFPFGSPFPYVCTDVMARRTHCS